MRKTAAVLIALLLTVTIMSPSVMAADPSNHLIYNGTNTSAIPLAYSVDTVMKGFGTDNSAISSATDMFIDNEDFLYILDAGNNRILKYQLTADSQEFVREYPLRDKLATKNPNGIHVDAGGDIYIADTDNGRVVHMGENGEYIEEFVQPESDQYDTQYAFRPYKVTLDSTGQMYIINFEDPHGFIILDAYNKFKGYIASTTVTKSLWDAVVGFFSTAEQKEKLGNKKPPMHSNATFHTDNTLFVTTARANTQQLKRFSSVGENVFPLTGSFGIDYTHGFVFNIDTVGLEAKFVDVCVDKDGNASMIDAVSGKIYQYNTEGIMLCSFGGAGGWAGTFASPSAIDCDSFGKIYVLDQGAGTVQIFKPTSFIRDVHNAQRLYNDGKYVEAIEPWSEIAKHTTTYEMANLGLGKAYLKQEDWDMAMEYYKRANDMSGYSLAFDGMRRQLLNQYFGLVVLAIVLLAVGSVLGVVRLRKYAHRFREGRR